MHGVRADTDNFLLARAIAIKPLRQKLTHVRMACESVVCVTILSFSRDRLRVPIPNDERIKLDLSLTWV